MNAISLIVLWGALAIAAAGMAFVLAGLKNRDYSFWIAISFLLPPMVLVLALLPRRQGRRPRQQTLDELDASEST